MSTTLTALESYVETHGIFGAISLLSTVIRRETNLSKKEFFINCKNILVITRNGKIGEADKRYTKMLSLIRQSSDL